MAKYFDIIVKGSDENIRKLVDDVFTFSGFSINWTDQTKGRATKGSRGANIALGVLAQHYVVDFELHPSMEGRTLRLIKASSGAAGGLLGMRKANKQFEQLSDTLAGWFKQQGLLLGVRKQ